ncbi:hypothetical protein LTS18_000453, partial [Coniosporium uncinatum]
MEREANDETYLQDLESRVVGATSEEDKANAVVQGLRKELTRARDNESSCEEYISTLEERLAEAEHDHELMQREIDRLEHVVERQRSIGKLDNLLYELDNIRRNDSKASNNESRVNGHSKQESHSHRSFHEDDPPEVESGAQDEARELGVESHAATQGLDRAVAAAEHAASQAERVLRPEATRSASQTPQSPAQARFVADKLETVTQELFDLRMEHETTVSDYDELARKYQVA